MKNRVCLLVLAVAGICSYGYAMEVAQVAPQEEDVKITLQDGEKTIKKEDWEAIKSVIDPSVREPLEGGGNIAIPAVSYVGLQELKKLIPEIKAGESLPEYELISPLSLIKGKGRLFTIPEIEYRSAGLIPKLDDMYETKQCAEFRALLEAAEFLGVKPLQEAFKKWIQGFLNDRAPSLRSLEENEKEFVKTILTSQVGQRMISAKQAGYLLLRVVPTNDTNLVRLLIDLKAQVDNLDVIKGCRTALMIASVCGYKEIAQMLINAGADVDFALSNGENALQLATKYQHKDLELLLASGAKDSMR